MLDLIPRFGSVTSCDTWPATFHMSDSEKIKRFMSKGSPSRTESTLRALRLAVGRPPVGFCESDALVIVSLAPRTLRVVPLF